MLKRTFMKTLSYGVMHMSLAVLVAYILSRQWRVALAIGLIEPCVQTVAFFFHERAWHRLEHRKHQRDYHDSIIDSVSPAAKPVEKIIRKNELR